jgi:glutaredoxin
VETRISSAVHATYIHGAETQTMPKPTLILITSDGCHFCERAHDILESLGIPAREIDVETDEALTLAEAGVPLAFLPVLWDGARVVAYGRFSEQRLRRELSAA